MALFGKRDKEPPATNPNSQMRPVPGKQALCRICNARQSFSRCWIRVSFVTQCTGCGATLDSPESLYADFQPACPRCGEFLEQPQFTYGLCDGCGSKFELMDGTRPGLLPNRQQRAAMEANGKTWKRS